MATLGTLWFDTKLKSTAVTDAANIKRQILQKLGSSIPVKLKLTFDKQDLKKDLQTQLAGFKPKIHVDIIVDQASATKIVQDALAKAGLQNNMTAGMLRAQKAAEIQQRMADRHAESMARLARTQQSAAAAAQRHADSVMSLNARFGDGIRVSGQLSSMMAGMYSVHALQQFLGNIIEIGGQLEKQRISMGAILGDTARANELFDQIKGLAVQSPFGVVELDQYSKQLAAFGIEQSELFDMTKRLADISAGAGQDIGRLALALGHVKSATYLTGITLRQFSMNNIPMLKMLADYYTEVEKRAVTTAEVQKRISKRQVSYDDVVEQIKRMTDAGGMFYDMQAKISDSVAAKWKNLRDSMDIMYGDLAESAVGDMLKGTAETLMELTKRWKQVGVAIATAVATFGVMKVFTLASNAAIGQNTAATLKNVMAMKQKEIANLRVAQTYRQLTAAEMQKVLSGKRLTASDLEQAMMSGALTKEQTLRIVAMKKLAVAEAQALVGINGITQAEISGALAAKRFNVYMAQLSASIQSVGASLLRSVFSWQNAIFALIMVGTQLWFKQKEESDRLKELQDDIFNRQEEAIKKSHEMMEKTKMTVENSEIKAPMASEVDGVTMQKNIELWTEFIKEYSATPNLMLEAAYATDENGKSVMTLAERYDYLRDKVLNVLVPSLELYAKIGDIFTASIDIADSGVFDDDLLSDLKDFEDEYKSLRRSVENQYKSNKRLVVQTLEAARTDEKFAEALEKAGIGVDNYTEQLMLLTVQQDNYTEAVRRYKAEYSRMTNVSINSLGTYDYRKSLEEMKNEFEQFARDAASRLESQGYDPQNMPAHVREQYEEAFSKVFAEMITKAEVSSEEVKKIFMELASTKFPIKLDIDEVKVKMQTNLIKEQLDKLVEGDFTIDIKTSTNAFDVIQAIREGYKSAKDTIENAKPILMKMGLDANYVGTVMNEEMIEQFAQGDEMVKSILMGVREAQKKISDAMAASQKYNFSLTDPTQGGKVFRDKKAKEHKSEADKQLKEWREQLKEIQEFWREYEKLAKYMTDSEAVKRIRESGVFPRLFNGDVLSEDAGKSLEDALNRLLARVNANTADRKSFVVDVKKLIFDVDNKDLQDAADAVLKQMDEALKAQGKRWDLYKKLLDATGSRDLSGQIAFGEIISFDNYAEQLRAELEEALKTLPGGSSLSVTELLGWDDKQLADVGILEKGADGIYKKLEMLREEALKLQSANADLLIEALKNAKSLDTELDKITLKYDKTRAAILSNENLSQEKKDTLTGNANKNEDIEKAKARWEWFKKTTEGWGEIFSDLDRVTDQTISDMITKLESLLPTIQANEEVTKSLYEALDKLRNEQIQRNPFMGLWTTVKKITNSSDAKERREGQSDFTKRLKAIQDKFGALQDVLQPVISLFEALGEHDISDFFKIGSDAFGTALSVGGGLQQLGGLFDEKSGIGKALGAAGPWGAAAGAALSVATSIFAMHDKALQKEIEASQQRQKEMENLTKNLETALNRTLGGVYNTMATSGMIESLKKELKDDSFYGMLLEMIGQGRMRPYLKEETVSAVEEAERTKTYYDAAYASMLAQRDEIAHQMDAERDKKDSDTSRIADYKQQLEEIGDQIKNFAVDMAKTLYDIDVKGWAEELGDALVSAWAKGEDAVQAWKDKAASLMADLTKNIIVQKVIEGALNPVLDSVVAEMNAKKGKLDEGSVLTFGKALLDATDEAVSTTIGLLDVLNPAFERLFGTNLKDALSSEGSSSSGKNVIHGDFTEQETGLLLSYVNAIRADLSLQSGMVVALLPGIAEAMSGVSATGAAQVQLQEQIASNTLRNAEAAERIYDVLHRVAPTGEYVNVR